MLSAKAMKSSKRKTSGIAVFARAIAKTPLRAVAAIFNAIEVDPRAEVIVESRMLVYVAVSNAERGVRGEVQVVPTLLLSDRVVSDDRLCSGDD